MGRLFKLTLLIVVLNAVTQVYGQSRAGEQDTPQAATNPAAKAVDLGQLDGVNYVNNFFGLSLSIPQNWVVVNAQRREAMGEEIKQLISAPNQAKKSQIEDSINRSTLLLSLTKLPAGEPGNASFMLVAERLPLPSIKTGADVIRAMKNAMTNTNFNIEFLSEVHNVPIGGAPFSIVTVKNSSQYGTFTQKIYVTTKNGYSLQFFYTYLNESDLPAFDAIIKSIKPT